jgi:hypothetical protein
MLFPEPAAQIGRRLGIGPRYHGDTDARLPWTHRREPFDIQSSNTRARKNHVGGTLLWTSQAVLWLVEGSGGENHFRISCSIWFPEARF